MLEHTFVEDPAPAPAAPAELLLVELLQAAAKSRRAAPRTAGTAARRMPTERGSNIGNLQPPGTGSRTCRASTRSAATIFTYGSVNRKRYMSSTPFSPARPAARHTS